MRFVRATLLLLCLAIPLSARQRFNGNCILVTGTVSGTTVAIYSASCTVTVFNSGTATLSTLFSDNIGTPLANPFTASSNSQYDFYADDGAYDIVLTGGTPSVGTYTIGAVSLGLNGITTTAPTITSFVNAQHNHTNAAGGGQLTDAALSAAVGFAKGGTGLTTAADDTTLVSTGAAWQAKALPNCTDTGGNHLNYTVATNAFSCGTSGGGANTALSNLASVAINTALLPGAAGTIDLGSTTLPFRNVYVGGAATNNNKIASAATGAARTFTLPDADSNPVRPDTGAANNFLTAIAATGVISKAQPSAANLSDGVTGTGAVVLATSPTIVTPTIASLTNAQHNHTNAAGGGQITSAALSAAVTVAKGGTGADLSATGGANQIVKQTSAGGVLTVAALTAANITAGGGATLTSGAVPTTQGGTGATTLVSRYSAFCSGVATASATLFVQPHPETTCTITAEANAQRFLAPSAGTLRNLRVLVSATGSAAGSGATTLRINGVDTTVTCTIGSVGTTCSDTTHTAAVAAGDQITVKVVTQGAETLANVLVGFEF